MNNLNTFLDFMELIWKKDSKIFESFVISNNQAISRIFESVVTMFWLNTNYTVVPESFETITPDLTPNVTKFSEPY